MITGRITINRPDECRMIHDVSYSFTAILVDETTTSAREREDPAYNTMRFRKADEEGSPDKYWIEWESSQDDYIEIGIWVDENDELSDYDGVFSLSHQAVELLEMAGIVVGEDWKE